MARKRQPCRSDIQDWHVFISHDPSGPSEAVRGTTAGEGNPSSRVPAAGSGHSPPRQGKACWRSYVWAWAVAWDECNTRRTSRNYLLARYMGRRRAGKPTGLCRLAAAAPSRGCIVGDHLRIGRHGTAPTKAIDCVLVFHDARLGPQPLATMLADDALDVWSVFIPM